MGPPAGIDRPPCGGPVVFARRTTVSWIAKRVVTNPESYWELSRISFKRKQKQPARFSLSNLFSDTAPQDSATRRQRSSSASRIAGRRPPGDWSTTSPRGHTRAWSNGDVDNVKDDGPLDWHVEGLGRRVGYDDFTAIDWIFEYTKERQRKRLLYSSGQGFLGHLRQVLDATYVWIVLVATGVSVGLIAACITIASDWLGDIKEGYCRSDRGIVQFYLNRSFCCWGHEGTPCPFGYLFGLLMDSRPLGMCRMGILGEST